MTGLFLGVRASSRLASINPVRRMTCTPFIALIAACVVLAPLAAATLRAGDIVLHNHSSSMSKGLYLQTDPPPARPCGDRACNRRCACGDAGDRFLKRIAGRHGDFVCAQGRDVSLNSESLASRLTADATGQTLETWSGSVSMRAAV